MAYNFIPGVTLQGDLSEALQFNDFYTIDKRLRSGSYGTVYVTRHKESGEEFAVKVIDRRKLKKKSDDDGVFREVDVLKDLSDVQGIVSLIDFFVQPDEFHIVQVFAKGGDVFDRLARRTTYSEEDARKLARRLLETMRDMHKRGYVHRDLKPENLLLKYEEVDSNILVADFGFSRKIPLEGLRTRCGTPAFVAPEILVGSSYREPIDMWSVGVLLFLLIGGYPPYQDEHHRGLFRKIRAADYIFHESYWEHVSIDAKVLISSLMCQPRAPLDCRTSAGLQLIQAEDDALSSRSLTKPWPSYQQKTWDKEDAAAIKKTTLHPAFRDVYDLTKKVRTGSFATVWECVHKETQQVFAVKIINREGLKPSDDEAVMNEVAILQSLANRHVVQLLDFFEEKDYFYMVMEYMRGGDVFDRIVERNHYTEKDARDLVRILLKAVKFLHAQGVAHRDLKPQNLLLTSKDDDASIKIADFGFSRRVHTPQSLTTRCGTPTYVAPEILKNIPHDTKADMWSVGVITYVLLVGYPPFMEDKQQDLFRKIRSESMNSLKKIDGGIGGGYIPDQESAGYRSRTAIDRC
ncbi:serine/threonine kinase [Fragilaria crotonensis]|nr:serine/threonine kinase [Fragilaria crotonensis]